MSNTLVLNKSNIKAKTIITVSAVVIAVVLPQVFHAVGAVSGLGASLGSTFLPMHLSVLIAGFMAGPVVGIIAGILSPLISFAISGMPGAAMLPLMIIELAGYGLVAGLLSKVKMPIFFKLLITQLAGRIIRAIAILIAIYGLGNETLNTAQIWNIVLICLPGIMFQWAFVPLLSYPLEGLKKYYE